MKNGDRNLFRSVTNLPFARLDLRWPEIRVNQDGREPANCDGTTARSIPHSGTRDSCGLSDMSPLLAASPYRPVSVSWHLKIWEESGNEQAKCCDLSRRGRRRGVLVLVSPGAALRQQDSE